MEEVVFCEGCHRVLSAEYQYCPYCGREQAPNRAVLPGTQQDEEAATVEPVSFEAMVENSLDRVQESVRDYTIRRLDEFLLKIGRLESELDQILLPEPPAPGDRSVITASATSAGVILSGPASSVSEDPR
jgi:hypothetical protein